MTTPLWRANENRWEWRRGRSVMYNSKPYWARKDDSAYTVVAQWKIYTKTRGTVPFEAELLSVMLKLDWSIFEIPIILVGFYISVT